MDQLKDRAEVISKTNNGKGMFEAFIKVAIILGWTTFLIQISFPNFKNALVQSPNIALKTADSEYYHIRERQFSEIDITCT